MSVRTKHRRKLGSGSARPSTEDEWAEAPMGAASVPLPTPSSSSAGSFAFLEYVQKEDLRIAEQLEEMDGAASQKCRSPLKMARSIAHKFRRGGVANEKAGSYEGVWC